MKNRGTRSGIYALVAAFLLFTAYDLFTARNDTETTMTPAVRIIFIAFFTVAGLALIVFAWKTWKQDEKDEEDDKENDKDTKGFK